jgi:hypothetical protein
MLALLKDLNARAEELSGTRLLAALAVIFIVFFAFAFGLNYFINTFLKSNEIPGANGNGVEVVVEKSYDGMITYVDPRSYPEDNISYELADAKGKRIILLKAKDQKLEVSEGLFVTVAGTLTKTADGEEVLMVDKIVIGRN